MNSILSRTRRRMRQSPVTAVPAAVRPDLHWIHDGMRYRVTVAPEVRLEREAAPDEWVASEGGEGVFASTALALNAAQWRRFLEFLPAPQQAFVRSFEFGRMGALHVITRCPELLSELQQTPALTPFLVAHVGLRGGRQPGWAEISAVFEREGIFGVLQWLGLPASRQTLAILQNIADPDVPRRLLEPLRAALWDPETIWTLAHSPALTDEQLARACHALAA